MQLRMKDSPVQEVKKTAQLIRQITRNTATRFIVNDFLDVAIDTGADGVHLGQDDVDITVARRKWKAKGKMYGLSTHNERQAGAAEEISPDYIGVGPIFSTPTKAVPDPVVGLERMENIIRSSSFPAVAIGGINGKNLVDVLSHEAKNFCAVRPVMQSAEPEKVIGGLMEIWKAMV